MRWPPSLSLRIHVMRHIRTGWVYLKKHKMKNCIKFPSEKFPRVTAKCSGTQRTSITDKISSVFSSKYYPGIQIMQISEMTDILDFSFPTGWSQVRSSGDHMQPKISTEQQTRKWSQPVLDRKAQKNEKLTIIGNSCNLHWLIERTRP